MYCKKQIYGNWIYWKVNSSGKKNTHPPFTLTWNDQQTVQCPPPQQVCQIFGGVAFLLFWQWGQLVMSSYLELNRTNDFIATYWNSATPGGLIYLYELISPSNLWLNYLIMTWIDLLNLWLIINRFIFKLHSTLLFGIFWLNQILLAISKRSPIQGKGKIEHYTDTKR